MTLSTLIEINPSWFHVKVVCVAGVGFFTDAYDIFSISIVATMLGIVYHNGATSLGTNQDLGVKIATPIGNIVGQLLFGWLADVVGRKRMCTCVDSTWTDMGLIFHSRRY